MANIPNISFYGKDASKELVAHDETSDFLDTDVKAVYQISTDRSEATKQQEILEENDVVEMEFDDGFIRIMTAEQLKEEYPSQVKRGAKGEEDIISIPAFMETEDASRGIVKNLLKKLLIRTVEDKLVSYAAEELARRIENKLDPSEGLYHCQNPNRLGERLQSSEDIKPLKPSLILIHGTASNTASSFGGLMEKDEESAAWKEIRSMYEDRIFALEHKTLSKSPLENALLLLDILPKNAKIHLMTHSRGGLVGEILCRGQIQRNKPFTDTEINHFNKPRREEQAELLKKLNTQLINKEIKVEKFVRIACPASGTTLASRRLDIYLTVILNLIGLVPYLKGNPIYGYVKSLLLAFVKKRADISVLPGLESMIPQSPLITVLNNASYKIDSELYVIAGDVKAHGIGHSIKVFLTDVFYREQHDFVVNTISMFGGLQRSNTYYTFYSHKDVSHFNYFINQKSQNQIAQALKADGLPAKDFKSLTQVLLAEFAKDKVRARLEFKRPDEIKEKDAPYVFVLPGIMGSKLSVDNDSVWVNPFRLSVGEMTRLDIGAKKVKPFALMGSAYKSLVRELEKEYNVIPYPFDWRLSILDSATKLAKDLNDLMEITDQPIRIMGHSMGGLVAHAVYSNHQDIWKKFSDREGSRMIFLGSPLKGSHVILSLFLRKHRLFKILHSIDLKNDSTTLLGLISAYPGLIQLLPTEAEFEYHTNQIWEELENSEDEFVKPGTKVLNEAKNLATLFKDHPIKGENVIYVAGKNNKTPYKLEFDKSGKIELWGTSEGDGCVTWASGIPAKLADRTWYMDEKHEKLCDSRRNFPALLDLLETGTTHRLANKPLRYRGELDDFVMPEDYPLTLNNEFLLENAIMGISPSFGVDAPERKVNIKVCHGDLGNASYPVLVGHHADDTIMSAEAVVDFYMNGRLSQYHEVGVYPGRIESSLVLLNEEYLVDDNDKKTDKSKFSGAVVVGLGVYGELTEGKLIRSFTHALIDYTMNCVKAEEDCFADKEAHEPINIGISSLLIASDYSGLNINNSIRGLLRAVIQANATLKGTNSTVAPFIESIEIIEIFKDRAIQASHSLSKIIEEPGLVDHFGFDATTIHEISGMRSRVLTEERDVWWERLKITGENDEDPCEKDEDAKRSNNNPLEFVSLTDRARAPEEIKVTQRNLIDNLIESAVQSSDWNEQTAKTLFHLLIPNNFKDYALDAKNLIMVVDEQSAKYPWEILHLPNSRDNAPLATQIGLVRQLITPVYDLSVKPVVENSILVIGSPKTPKDKNYADLPSAIEEAKSVISLFSEKEFVPVPSIEDTSEEVIKKLFSRNYKVIHMAGHGDIDDDDPMRTGMVLDKDVFITATEIDSLPQTPEFVFINCCYLGKDLDQRRDVKFNQLAANVGTQFIRKGVKAVVAAGWAVNDDAAKHFAESLYKALFNGDPFGVALTQARNSTYRQHQRSNTWGAYQCYGDPHYRLVKEKDRKKSEKPKHYVDPVEVIIELENIANRSEPASSRDQTKLLDELNLVIKGIHKKWMRNSMVIEAIANVYYELSMYEEAVQYFEILRNIPDGLSSLAALHKLANLKMKIALEEHRENNSLSQNTKEEIKDAKEIIEHLLHIGSTFRRYALKGGHFKRQALTNTEVKDVIRDLVTAVEAYKAAHKLILNLESNYYSIVNWITLEKVISIYGKRRSKELNAAIDKLNLIKEGHKKSEIGKNSFWERTRKSTLKIYEILEKSTQKEPRLTIAEIEKMHNDIIDEIEKDYKQNWCNGGSIRKAENILGQVRFLIEILDKYLKAESKEFRISNKRKIQSLIKSYKKLDVKLTNLFNK